MGPIKRLGLGDSYIDRLRAVARFSYVAWLAALISVNRHRYGSPWQSLDRTGGIRGEASSGGRGVDGIRSLLDRFNRKSKIPKK